MSASVLRLNLDQTSRDPLHERIAAAIRRAVADDKLSAGSHLPPSRELASQLDVHVNTVLRAYRQLADEQFIDLRRGRPATILATASRTRLYTLADELLAEAARLGITRGELAVLLARRS